jgi:DNA-binding SARP family transcriptional activator
MSVLNPESSTVICDAGLEIHMLGQFKVSDGQNLILGKTGRFSKTLELLMYLITNRERLLPPEAIRDALWPEDDNDDTGKMLKNLVHRLRKKIDFKAGSSSDSAIVYSRGCYSWNRSLDYWLDSEVFETLCRQGRELAGQNPEEAIRKCYEALNLYSGDYLSELSCSEWVIPIRHYYRQLFLRSVFELLELYKSAKRYSDITMICEKTFLVENFDEDLHLRYLEALFEEGRLAQARNHYQYITSLLYREFSAKPSETMQAIYKKICKGNNKASLNYSNIQELVADCQVYDGAMFCDPQAFDLICKLEKRRAVRDENSLYIATITLTDPDFRQPSPDILSEAMAALKEVLFRCLRKGDVFTEWNEAQYLVLILAVNLNDVEAVIKRIKESFFQKSTRGAVVPRSSIHQLNTAEEIKV